MLLYQNLNKLRDFIPKDRHITSLKEINYIKETLDLEHASNDDLRNYRDMCVMMWEHMCDTREDGYERMGAMQSITAVIDSVQFTRGMEV